MKCEYIYIYIYIYIPEYTVRQAQDGPRGPSHLAQPSHGWVGVGRDHRLALLRQSEEVMSRVGLGRYVSWASGHKDRIPSHVCTTRRSDAAKEHSGCYRFGRGFSV